MKKGEIYFISRGYNPDATNTLQPGRPAVVVSCENVNNIQNVVTVIYLTSKPKMDTPTHFVTHCNGITGTAIAESISTVDKSSVGKYVGTLSNEEMECLNACLRYMFDINKSICDTHVEDMGELSKQIESYRTVLKNVLGERHD